jgi:hypothetical protein
VYPNVRMNHTTALFAIAAIAATLLAAGAVAALGSNHSAFAWKHKEYKNKYDNNKYAREDKSDGNNIIHAEQSVKCIVVGHDDGMKKPDGVKTTVTTDEDGHAIGPNSCNATQDLTNNDGGSSTPPTLKCPALTGTTSTSGPDASGNCTGNFSNDSAANRAACAAAEGTFVHVGNTFTCTYPATPRVM